MRIDQLNLPKGFEERLRSLLPNPAKAFPNGQLDFEEIAYQANALYRAVKRKDGLGWMTPLTGYAGTYPVGQDKLQFVGPDYFSITVIEEHPILLPLYGAGIGHIMEEAGLLEEESTICSLPYGGLSLGTAAFLYLSKGRLIKGEKITTALATPTLREQTETQLKRHRVKKKERIILFDDVGNNYSTMEQFLEVLIKAGAIPIAYVCGLNRSEKFRHTFTSERLELEIPIYAPINRPFPQFRQDDQLVLDHIAHDGRILLKPKYEDWLWLIAQMRQAEAALAAQ
jgi:adenine/guanine phosphoribosyltransferase-like PRPP-binding protein